MEETQIGDFPRYKDGDVAIYISSTKVFQLHSSVLRRNSRVFRDLLDSVPAVKLSKQAREQNLPCYRIDLIKLNHDDQNEVGFFRRKTLDVQGRCRDDEMGMEFEAGKIVNELHRYWEWLFGALYNRQPEFEDQTLAVVLNACMGLIDVAESVEAVDTVHEIVDLALLRQGKTLWESIARNPTVWAELGRRVHSPMIFKESVCHIVGRWQNLEEDEKTGMHADVFSLCERKHHEIDLAKRAVELRILGHYPASLCRNAADKPGRPSYSNDIYMWMAICFFRQWFAQCIDDDKGRRNKDGGYTFYTSLSKGGQAYLNHVTFREFHQYFPMSSKACNILELNMTNLKEEIRSFVGDLVRTQVHLDLNEHHVSWLTCCVITKEDYPWSKHQDDGEQEEEIGAIFPGTSLQIRHRHGIDNGDAEIGIDSFLKESSFNGNDTGYGAYIEG